MHLDITTVSTCALVVASLSFLLSGTVAWFTLIRRGRLQMTRPSLIVLMHDNLGSGEVVPKIFLRTLLYATGNRGHIIQAMYLKIQRGETTQNFSVWGHAPQNEIKFGAGLRVGPDGVDHNHHFNPPKNVHFDYLPGEYKIDVFSEMAGSGKVIRLGSSRLTLTAEQAESLKDTQAGLFFEWGPDSGNYSSHVHVRPEKIGFNQFLELLSKNESRY